jgi:hypothetical protein
MCLCLHQSKQHYVLYSLQNNSCCTWRRRYTTDCSTRNFCAVSCRCMSFFLLIIHKTQAAYVSRQQRCKHTLHPSIFWRHSHILFFTTKLCMPFPVAARSKAWVSDHLLAGIVGSNPAGGTSVCLLCVVWCQIEVSASDWSLVQRTRPEGSYRVWRVWVCSRILDNEEVWAHCRLLRHVKREKLGVWNYKVFMGDMESFND